MAYTNTIILALLISCISCKKEEGTRSYFSGTYSSDTIFKVERPVMYTANGLIYDSATIANFLRRWYITPDNFPFVTEQVSYFRPKISLLENNLAIISYREIGFTIGFYRSFVTSVTGLTDSLVTFSAIDTTQLGLGIGGSVDCTRASFDLLKPHYYQYCTPSYSACFQRINYYFNKVNGLLISIPIVSTLIKRGVNPRFDLCVGVQTNMWRLPSDSIVNTLLLTDTVIIQRKKLNVIRN